MEAFAMSESDPHFPVLDPASVEPRRGAPYPEHLRGPFAAREKRALGDPLGLTSFGVNLTRLPPGTASALRHWHSLEDEFVMVLEGEATLITDAGETVLEPGMAAGFPRERRTGTISSTVAKAMSSISKSGIAAPATMSPTRTMTWRRFGAMAGASTSTRMGGLTENDRWFEQVGLSKVVAVGHSMGGVIVLQLCARYVLQSLVLCPAGRTLRP